MYKGCGGWEEEEYVRIGSLVRDLLFIIYGYFVIYVIGGVILFVIVFYFYKNYMR